MQADSKENLADADMRAARRYFSGDDDDDSGWHQHQGKAGPAPVPEGVSSSTIVSGLVASRKSDHAVSPFAHLISGQTNMCLTS